jgi:hypothetical protein
MMELPEEPEEPEEPGTRTGYRFHGSSVTPARRFA